MPIKVNTDYLKEKIDAIYEKQYKLDEKIIIESREKELRKLVSQKDNLKDMVNKIEKEINHRKDNLLLVQVPFSTKYIIEQNGTENPQYQVSNSEAAYYESKFNRIKEIKQEVYSLDEHQFSNPQINQAFDSIKKAINELEVSGYGGIGELKDTNFYETANEQHHFLDGKTFDELEQLYGSAPYLEQPKIEMAFERNNLFNFINESIQVFEMYKDIDIDMVNEFDFSDIIQYGADIEDPNINNDSLNYDGFAY